MVVEVLETAGEYFADSIYYGLTKLIFPRWQPDTQEDYNNNRGYGYDRSGGRSGGYGGGFNRDNRGGGRDFYQSGPRKNELGFHGDMRPNPRVEQELFHTNEGQTAGINFDRVSTTNS